MRRTPPSLPTELAQVIERLNPLWRAEPGPPLPPYRRWPFDALMHHLKQGLTPAVLLRGPRRVGKTVLLRQVIQALIREGVDGRRILYLPFDELPDLARLRMPILTVPFWYQDRYLGRSFNQAAHGGKSAFLFLDETRALYPLREVKAREEIEVPETYPSGM